MKQLPPPKREPIFTPGAGWFLAEFVTTFAVLWLFGEALGFVYRLLGL